METLAQLIKRIPLVCWGMVCLCMMLYTTTLCVVMLRSSQVNVTINCMTMAMSKAVNAQESAAGDLEAAAATIAKLQSTINELKIEKIAKEYPIPFATPPSVEIPSSLILPSSAKNYEQQLHQKASKIRTEAAQMQQQVQNFTPQQ